MIDYKNGIIYRLVCNDTGEVYIGSTTYSIEDRLKIHQQPNQGCCSKQIIDRNNYAIEILETYPCDSKHELRRKEGEYQKTMKCINLRIAGRTDAEYYKDNKERRCEYGRIYHQENIERLKEYDKQPSVREKKKIRDNKVDVCECGMKITHGHLTRHKTTKRHINLMAKLTKPPSSTQV
tara:strand:+ start:356 stop:892 length:537 start_codon:yes stop_codon:yes gene_type:complete